MSRFTLPHGPIECEALEPRRLLCTNVDLHGLGTVLAPDGPGTGRVGSAASSTDAGGVDVLIVPPYSSRPGATRKLFLDFNGHAAINNWGGWWEFGGHDVSQTPPYDIDGDTNSYSNQELSNIQRIWKGVAEKFSPFNVDVTTIQPPTINGVRVVIGGDGAWYGTGGGVGIVGGWGESGFTEANSGNVAFVWAGQANPAYVADAASHEAGHTLGLYHQSRPPIEYAAGFIMGTGGRWGSTSVHGTVATSLNDDGDLVDEGAQDDLAVITSGNGFGYRPDDHGNATAAATPLTLTSVSGLLEGAAQGVIANAFDLDFFRVNHPGGSLDVEVLAAEFRRMLDPEVTLHNAAGAVIAASAINNGSDGVGERIQFNNLSASTYYVAVGGSGDYGDIGQFRMNVRVQFSATQFNDTLNMATPLGLFGGTEGTALALGFAGTAIINDSLTTGDNFDYFRFGTPANTRLLFVQLGSLTLSAGAGLIDDANGNGVLDAGELIGSVPPSTSPQSITHNAAASGKTYFVFVNRESGASGNYTLRITADTAPPSLPPSVPSATYDPQPLRGGRVTYDSIEALAGDTVDYYRVTPEIAGLFSFYMNHATADLRLDVGRDTNLNGTLEAGEIVATAATAAFSEFLQNVSVAQGQQMLVRVMAQSAGLSSNYSLAAVADYATGGNTTGSLAGARDLTSMRAGSIYEYLDGSVDFYDTFRIAPPPGPLTAQLHMLEAGLSHRLDVVRDANNNNVVDPGEVVASGVGGEALAHTVTAGANYYLRVASQQFKFPSVGNYRLAFATAGAVTMDSFANATTIPVSPVPTSIGGYLAFDPIDPALSDLQDHYRFTLAARTRFDVSITGTGMGVQVGQLDGGGIFRRVGGVGMNQGAVNALNVNLDPGTYYIRAYLPLGERQDTSAGGNYNLLFKTSAITDNAAPLVTSSAFQYEVAATGVSFTVDQDVAGSVDPSDVVIRNLATNVTYPVGETFYDPVTRRIGYGVADGVLPDGNYRATLLAGSIRDTSANPLAADYALDFFVLAGDANRDRRVDLLDFNVLAGNFGQGPRTFGQGDFNYDRLINLADFNVLAGRFGVIVAPDEFAAHATGADRGTDYLRAVIERALGETDEEESHDDSATS